MMFPRLFLLISLVSTLSHCDAQNDFQLVNPFDRATYKFGVSNASDKAKKIADFESAVNIPINTVVGKSGNNSIENLLLLDKETGEIAFDIKNAVNKHIEYIITCDLPDEWGVKIRRQAYVTDFYTHQRRSDLNVNLLGDALPLLVKGDGGKWTISLRPQEVARIFIEFTADAQSFNNRKDFKISTRAVSGGKNFEKAVPLKVINRALPDVSFPSAVYNNNTYQIASYAGELVKAGFSHIIVNAYPSMIFNQKGGVVSTQGNTASSQQFRYVTDFWAKQNKPIILNISARYDKLAPLENGKDFLVPFSPEWMEAYVNIVNASYNSIKSRYPGFKESDFIIYVYDELSSGQLTNSPSKKVKDVSNLLQFFKKNIPQFQTYLTFGYYTYPEDIAATIPYAGIVSPHIIMPDKLTRNAPATYNPAKAFKDNIYDVVASQTQEGKAYNGLYNKAPISAKSKKNIPAFNNKISQWSYIVTQGKTSNILDFRALPIYAILLGKEGLSWWAFSDTKGSSWLASDANSLDYSMVYNNEPNNALYKYWCKNTAELFIPSVRLMAARAGIEDAKLLKFLLDNQNKLGGSDRKKLDGITKRLSNTVDLQNMQPNPNKYFALEEYENISQVLREIYANL